MGLGQELAKIKGDVRVKLHSVRARKIEFFCFWEMENHGNDAEISQTQGCDGYC